MIQNSANKMANANTETLSPVETEIWDSELNVESNNTTQNENVRTIPIIVDQTVEVSRVNSS